MSEQKVDDRPGYYYVSALPGLGEVKDKYWLLAGPWLTHAEALAQVQPVWDYARRRDPVGSEWKAFGTCRLEEAKASKLGTNDQVWKGHKPTQEEVAIYLSKHKDFRGIMGTGLSVLVCREGATVLVPVAQLTAEERAYDSSRGRFTRDERAEAKQLGIELPVDAPTSEEQILGAAVAKAKRRVRR